MKPHGSNFDTVLYVMRACDGEILFCNDDDGEERCSEVIIPLEEGEEILIVAKGLSNISVGDCVVNINNY